MIAFCTATLLIWGPLQLFAVALLTEITREWANLKESKEGEEFADPILDGSAGQAPLIGGLEGETGLGDASGTLLIKRNENESAWQEV